LLVVEEADFSAIQKYVARFGSDNKGQGQAGGNAQSADLTSLTMAFGVLDKMMLVYAVYFIIHGNFGVLKSNRKVKG